MSEKLIEAVELLAIALEYPEGNPCRNGYVQEAREAVRQVRREQDQPAQGDKCPKCGSDDPDAFGEVGQFSYCPHPWHTANPAPNLAQTPPVQDEGPPGVATAIRVQGYWIEKWKYDQALSALATAEQARDEAIQRATTAEFNWKAQQALVGQVERERDGAREMYEDAERRAKHWHKKADHRADQTREALARARRAESLPAKYRERIERHKIASLPFGTPAPRDLKLWSLLDTEEGER